MSFRIEQLEEELKSKKQRPIYLLYGNEKFLLEGCLKKIKNNFGEKIAGINYITIGEEEIEELIKDIQTPAFGYEKKLIIIKNSKLFSKEAKRKNPKEEIIKNISKYIEENSEEIKETVVLVFVEDEVNKNELYSSIEKNGCICEFNQLKPVQILTRIKNICNAYKVNIDNQTVNYFIEQCGTNMQDLINEIRKLIEYVGNQGTIKKEDIELLSIKQIQAVIFDLTDNLGKKEIKKALEVLNNLIYNKEPIQKILVTLYNHFKKLYIVKLAKEYRKSIEESLKLKPNQTFLINKYTAQSNYFRKEELREILQELSDLDFNYKQGNIDINIGLEAILCRYCS